MTNRVEYPLVQATLTRRYTERRCDSSSGTGTAPFFLYFAHAMPHKPLACSEAFYKKSGAGLYGDVLAELDWSVGQVLARLKDLDLDRRTLVIFTSDNGPWFGGSTGGLRGMKSTTWEGGFRVPCIATMAGPAARRRRLPAPAVTMDLFATALAAAEIGPPRDRVIDGKDLLPLLIGKSPRSPRRRVRSARPASWRPSATPDGSCTCSRPRILARQSRPAAGSMRGGRTA